MSDYDKGLLFNGTQFKFSFDKQGRASCFANYKNDLDGRWVALVDATNDGHILAEASKPASQPDCVAVPVFLLQSWHDFWANYSSLNEDCQDDLNEKRHQVLDEMLRAAKEPAK
jgi:hypothetical protein